MNRSPNGFRNVPQFDQPPQRVVSLVPSLSESLIDLELSDVLVGVTDYCVHPAGKLSAIPKVGGTKTPSIEKIIELKPDLVLLNQEENSKEVVEKLEAEGINIWVSFPKTIREALDVLWTIVGVYQNKLAAIRLEVLERNVDWAESALFDKPKLRYFCPIWQGKINSGLDWWMTFNQSTYVHDVLRLMGGENIFADRQRKYPIEADLGVTDPEEPGDRDTRYPHVTAEEIQERDPQLILLPNEPFEFSDKHKHILQDKLEATEACKSGQLFFVDGSLLTWHGTRLAKALQELPEYFF